MAWTELPHRRTQRSRVYQNDANPLKRAWSGTLAALHYESVLDSSVYDAEVDMSPIRVDVPAFDGWRVTRSGWHYALGRDLAGHGSQDGWVGLGGRMGQHWFKFRLLRTGYLHWPTRDWDDIGGLPTYNRANLNQEIGTLTIGPNDDEIAVQTVATWSNIWPTPGGGDLSVRWSANPDRLKEEIVVSQVAREWIATNRPPGTPLNETYFSFVFHLDWSDIPRIYRAGILQNIDGDFADDGESIELRDVLDRLLAFLPISQVYIPDHELDEGEEWPQLRKRFYKDGDDHYLLVGIRCDILNSLPTGDLVFDPTVDVQVGAGVDDVEAWGAVGFSNVGAKAKVGFDTKVRHRAFRWTAVTISGTIDVSHIELNGDNVSPTAGAPLMKVYGVDEDNPPAPTTRAEFDADPLTAASVDWDVGFGAAWNQSPSLNTIFQELVDTYTIAADAVMVQVKDDGGGANDWNNITSFDGAAADAAKLHIEYTVAAVGGHMTLWGRYWGP